MRKLAMMATTAALVVAGTASAEAFNGEKQIARGDYAAAERSLVAQRALYPDSVVLMMNLATVYLHTGRAAEARRLYTAVAAQPDEEVVLTQGNSVWSHALAEQALQRLPMQVRVQVASR